MEKSNKKLSLFSLCVFGIGIIVGAGIYAILGVGAKEAGTTLWISFFAAAVVALLTGLSYCELATLYPKAGAEYHYLKAAYPQQKWASFVLGFILILAGCATATTVAVGFAGYVEEVQNFLEIPIYLSAFFLMVIITGINLLGIQGSSKANIIFTALEIIGLLLVIWFGLTTDSSITNPNFKITSGTFSATAIIFFVYLGFEDIVNLAEDTDKPSKNIPLAIIISVIVTTILYIAIAIAVMRISTPEILANSKIPLSEAIFKVAPKWVKILNIIALFSMANTVLITMLAVGKMIFGIAKDGQLLEVFSKTTQRKKVPRNAILITLVGSSLFLILSGLDELASVSSICALWGFFTVNWSVIILRYKESKLKRPFLVPLNIGKFPVLSGLGALSCLMLLTQFKFKIHLIVVGLVIVGFLLKILKDKKRPS